MLQYDKGHMKCTFQKCHPLSMCKTGAIFDPLKQVKDHSVHLCELAVAVLFSERRPLSLVGNYIKPILHNAAFALDRIGFFFFWYEFTGQVGLGATKSYIRSLFDRILRRMPRSIDQPTQLKYRTHFPCMIIQATKIKTPTALSQAFQRLRTLSLNIL